MSLEPNPNSVFEKQGVQFKIITEDMFQDVKDFMHTHFIPDEPVMRSMKVTRNWFTDNLWLQDCLKHKTSIAAVDEQGALLAVHLGQVQRHNDYGKWFFEKAILFVLKQKWLGELLNSEGLKKMYVLMKLTNQVDFDVWKMFDKFNCEKIFENKGLCSARAHGIRGLGTELVKRADALALQLGCSHRYVICSGLYSQKVFRNQNWTNIESFAYADFKDENGEEYLKDTREHTHVMTFFRNIM